MLDLPTAQELAMAHEELSEAVRPVLSHAYATQMKDGAPATIAHTYRVAVGRCGACGETNRQFPYSLLTLRNRKERKQPEAILACPNGHVFDGRADSIQTCPVCGETTDPKSIYTARRVIMCPSCGHSERLSDRASRDGWGWEVVLVERAGSGRREFAVPSPKEVEQANCGWNASKNLGVIPPGAETNVLLRHGFRTWDDLYPQRQRVVTEVLLELTEEIDASRAAKDTMRMAIVGSTEFAGHLCRWDRFYLKCNDATAGHRFNFSTFVPEINVWGAGLVGRGTVTRRVKSLTKAASWSQENIDEPEFTVACGDSAELRVPASSFDLVLTDPPYHDDVHYGELSLPFRAWADLPTASLDGEAAVNKTTGLNPEVGSYAESLERIFVSVRRALRENGRLIFSYANHEPEAWVELFDALQAARFHAVHCVLVHSENETDFKKRGVESCNEDLLMELSPLPIREQLSMSLEAGPFMFEVASLFTRVGHLEGDWQAGALAALHAARSR